MFAEQKTSIIRSRIEAIPKSFLFPPHNYGRDEFSKITGGVTVYLAEGVELIENHIGLEVVDGAQYVYSDRLEVKYGNDAATNFSELLSRQMLNDPTAQLIEGYLRNVVEDPSLILQHIKAGIKPSGHPYQLFGFTDTA